MPIELGFWRIDQALKPVTYEPMETESRLEALLDENISVVAPHLMVIGRQVRTAFDKIIDLLAINAEGELAIIELKREKTPRDIVAQILDYGSWVRTLRDDKIAQIYIDYLERWHPDRPAQSIDQAFCHHFKVKAMPDELNGDHELIIVAASLDADTERIVTYLSEFHEVAINAVFFRFFKDADREYLSRAWLREPTSDPEPIDDKEGGEWNGEYYVSFGADDKRDWEEARKYGFICGGGGAWYSNTLEMLEPDARVWVNIPGTGYVGVGRISSNRVPAEEFMVRREDGEMVPIVSLPLKIAASTKFTEKPESAEYLVGVRWDKAVSAAHAIKERGFFGNQNTVARPKAKKWVHTVERLKQRFGID